MNRTPRIRYFSGQSFRITISVSCFFFLKTSVDPKIYKKKSKWKKKHVFLLISYVRICFLFKIIACWVFVAFLSIIILVLPCLTTHTEKIIFFFKNPAPQDWIQVSACELVVLAATQGETSVLSRKSADVFVSKKKRGEWKMPTHKKSSDGPLLSLGSWKKDRHCRRKFTWCPIEIWKKKTENLTDSEKHTKYLYQRLFVVDFLLLSQLRKFFGNLSAWLINNCQIGKPASRFSRMLMVFKCCNFCWHGNPVEKSTHKIHPESLSIRHICT